jgi:hypothetical protein
MSDTSSGEAHRAIARLAYLPIHLFNQLLDLRQQQRIHSEWLLVFEDRQRVRRKQISLLSPWRRAVMAGLDLSIIQAIGDWHSDAVFF